MSFYEDMKKSLLEVIDMEKGSRKLKAGVEFSQIKSDMLKDDEFRMEYEKLKPEYEEIEQVIKASQENKE